LANITSKTERAADTVLDENSQD